MKIPAIRSIRNLGLAVLTAGTVICAPTAVLSQNKTDSFERTTVSVSGTSTDNVLAKAPDPTVEVLGENKKALFVVDITDNILYEYDREGTPLKAYSVATGKPSTPTDTGIRVVSHTETYPYKSAPTTTKRRKYPNDYGPKVIILRVLNPKTGETYSTGEFIHGNKDPKSLGKHESGGCIRMDNEVIKELSQKVKHGDIVVIKK